MKNCTEPQAPPTVSGNADRVLLGGPGASLFGENMKNPGRIWVNDVDGVYKNRIPINSYRVWRNMISRCYLAQNTSAYFGVTVCVEWLRFSVFKAWYDDNYKDGMELDKDIIGNGLVYSPDHCVFVPKSINGMAKTSGHTFARKWKRQWMSVMRASGKSHYIGLFKTQKEATKASYEAYAGLALSKIEEEFSSGSISEPIRSALIRKLNGLSKWSAKR